ncbi:MAG: hypothetical protein ACI4PR_04935 [Acutalibacteraceae bacterium]
MATVKLVYNDKGKNKKGLKSYTNVSKAKELLKKVIDGNGLSDIEENGFNFSYGSKSSSSKEFVPNGSLPEKFKTLFGKDGVMDLLADAWLTEDLMSTKKYSFADMRRELKERYKFLKLRTYEVAITGSITLSENDQKEVNNLNKDLNKILEKYQNELKEIVKKVKETKDKSEAMDEVENVLAGVVIGIQALVIMAANPVALALGAAITATGSILSTTDLLCKHGKIISDKKVIKGYQKEINEKYKKLKQIYMEYADRENVSVGNTDFNKNDLEKLEQKLKNKSLKIEAYDVKSLKNFSEACQTAARKYKVHVNKYKIWSKDLTKLKEIFKGGISKLMDENTYPEKQIS